MLNVFCNKSVNEVPNKIFLVKFGRMVVIGDYKFVCCIIDKFIAFEVVLYVSETSVGLFR